MPPQRRRVSLLAWILLGLFLSSFLIPASPFLEATPSRTAYQVLGTANQAFATASFAQYHLPNSSSQPWSIEYDAGSDLMWFVEQGSNQIGSLSPATGSFAEYQIPTPGSLPETLAIDSGHNVWFTQLNYSQLGFLNTGTGKFHEYSIPKGPDNLSCGPIGVSISREGNVWVTCEFSNQIDEFYPSNATFHEYDLPVFYSAPLQLVFDSEGNFWFTAADADMLGYVTTSQLQNGSSSGINEFSPTNQSYVATIQDPQAPSGELVSSLSTPSQLLLSPDGSTLWITEHIGSSFDKYNLQTKSLVKYWTSRTHNPDYLNSLPNGIAMDAQGNIWIAEHYANRIARFDPLSETLSEYPIPCCGAGLAGTLYLTTGPNNTVWFTEFFGNAIGELKPEQTNRVDFAPATLQNESAALTLDPGSNLTIPLLFTNSNHPAPNSTSLQFDIAGLTNSGNLQNLSANFQPPSISPGGAAPFETKLTLKAAPGIAAGIHYLTVSATDLRTNTSFSFILKVEVPFSEIQAQSNLIQAALAGVAISVVVVLSMFFILRRKPKRRSLRAASKRPKTSIF